MFYRQVITYLREWAVSEDRKPLILRGARQVGKTTAVEIFAGEFDNYIYLNLERKEDAEIFERNLSGADILQAIFFMSNVTYEEKKRTLLFIDEIQNSPRAAAMLRYFYESAGNLYVVAAGSLLEVMMGSAQVSFPVGRVRYLFMYPLTFAEFLEAGEEKAALELYHQVPLPDYAFSKFMGLFHHYTQIGGMPEVVNSYIKRKDLTALKPLYQGLLTAYLDDVSKYARGESMAQAIRHAIEAVPFEAGKRIKFQGFGQSSYKSREMGEALKTLERAMLIHLVYPATATKLPIGSDFKKSPRLQFLDTGLLNYAAGLQGNFFKYEDLHSFYQGIIAQHMVGQELMALDMNTPGKISFWVREQKQSNAEVDFLIPFQQYVIPVQVKAGKSGTLRSLHLFMDNVEHGYAVRLYAGPLQVTEALTPGGKAYKLLNLPYFLTGKIYDYLQWFTANNH